MAILQKTGITGSLSISSSGIRPTTSASLFNVNGYNGRLLSVVDTLSGSLFSVNSIAGLPIFEVFSNNRVVAGKYAANDFVISGSRVGIGTNSPSAKLAVAGAGTGLMLVGNSGFTGNFTAITLNNGTATTSYNLLSSPTDTTLYINRPSGGNINFREANSDQMTLLSGGLLGIGTTAPSYLLDIYKTTNDSIARIRTTTAGAYLYLDSATDGYFGTVMFSAGTGKWFLGGYGTSDLQIKRGAADTGTEVVRVTTTGNVGIATTSPSALLHVSGAAATTVVALFQGYVGIGTTSVNFPLQVRRPGGVGSLAINVDNYLGASTRDVLLKVNPDTVGDTGGFLFRSYNGADVNAMAILATGNIGIGTTSPDVRLDVFAGTLSSTANSTLNIATFRSLVSNASYLKIIEKRSSAGGGDWTTATTRIQKTIDSTDQAYIDFNPVGASYGIAFGTGATTPTQKMVINIDGNVGIGISSPTSKLHAVETTKTGSRIQLTTNTTDALMNANATNDLLILNAPYNANPASVSNAGAKWGIKFVGSLESNQINTNNKTSAIYAVSEDTGLGYNRGTSLAFYTNQFNDATYAERMRIFHNGNVGIGTTSPVSPLHVFNTAATLATFTRDLATDVGFNIGADSNGTVLSTAGAHAIQIYTNSTEKVRINSDGNVGIGTTSPSNKLTVAGSVDIGNQGLVAGQVGVLQIGSTANNYLFTGGTWTSDIRAGILANCADNWEMAIHDSGVRVASALAFFGGVSNNYIQMGRDIGWGVSPVVFAGSVGIGTTGPGYALDINGVTRFRDVVRFKNAAWNLSDDGQARFWFDTSGRTYFGSGNGYEWRSNADVGLMYLLNGGNLGIGTTSPASRLHVNGGNITLAATSAETPFQLLSYSNSDTLWIQSGIASKSEIVLSPNYALDWDRGLSFRYSPGTTGAAAGSLIIGQLNKNAATWTHGITAFNTNGTEKMRIQADGNVGIGTTGPSALLNIRASAPTSTGTVTTGTNLLIDSNTSNYITFRNTGDNATYAGLTFLDNNTGGYVVFRNYASNDVIGGSDCMIYGTYQDHIFQNGTSETINGKIETLRIKQNGSVGIGANSPSAKLHISSSTTTALRIETKVGSGTDTQIEYVGPDTHSYAIGIDNSDGNKFKISYAASRTPPNLGTNDRFVIQTDGKIGIGTSVAETDLSIVDMNLGRVGIGTVTYYGVWLTGGTSATDYSFLSSPSDTNLYLNAPSTKGIYNQINNQNRFIITTDFVRINNSAAGADGEEFQRWSYVSTDNYYLKLIQTVTAGVVRYNFCMVNNATAYNNILILDRGNVGIGSTSPAYKLDVTGTAAISGDVGIGGLIDTGARLYVQGESLTEPFLSVQTCLGNNSNSTATYNTLKGYLAVKIGNNVGSGTALITAGTYYLRLWGV